MPDVVISIFWTVVVFSILVVLHEGGHFLVARLFGVRVPEFMVGLPGPKISKRIGNTDYGVTAIPLGGYVRIAGMEPGPEDPQLAEALAALTRAGTLDTLEFAQALSVAPSRAVELAEILVGWDVASREELSDQVVRYAVHGGAREVDDPKALLDEARKGTYRALSTPKRIAVLSAGVVVNIVAAVVIFVGVLSIGGYDISSTTLESVSATGPAAQAGVRAGDVIVAIDAEPVESWNEVVDRIGSLAPGDVVTLEIERGDVGHSYDVTLVESEDGSGRAVMGIVSKPMRYRPPVTESLDIAIENVKMVGTAVAGLLSPKEFSNTVEQSTSIVGITKVTGEAAQAGPSMFAWLVAALSLSLGAMNLLPIPPLDGGKIVIEVVQGIVRREIPSKIQVGVSTVGFALLMTFFVYMLYADISRMVS